MGKNAQKTTILREFSSGGVVYKHEGKNIFWLIAASMPSSLFPKISWRLPKGWIDDLGPDIPGPMASGKIKADEESLQKTAIREVAEEGGVAANIVKKIGSQVFFYTHPVRGKIMKFVTFYLMEYAGEVPEGFDAETSEVVWLQFDKAYKKLTFSNEKKVLKEADILLASLA